MCKCCIAICWWNKQKASDFGAPFTSLGLKFNFQMLRWLREFASIVESVEKLTTSACQANCRRDLQLAHPCAPINSEILQTKRLYKYEINTFWDPLCKQQRLQRIRTSRGYSNNPIKLNWEWNTNRTWSMQWGLVIFSIMTTDSKIVRISIIAVRCLGE